MAVSWKGDNAFSAITNTGSGLMPTHAAGDMLLAIWTGKPFDGSVSVAGWTDLGSGASGTTAAGIDLWSMKAQVWWKEAASAAETAPSFVEGATVWNIAEIGVVAWQKDVSETWDAPVAVYGGDEDLDISPSITLASDPGVTAGDGIQVVFACNSDATTPFTAGPTVTQTGVTFGAVTKDRDQESTAGGDMGVVTAHCLATAGTSSAAPVIAGTGTADPGSPRIEGAFIRLRVSAGGAATSLIYQPNPLQHILVR